MQVWCADQAGPFQTVPQAGASWEPQGDPARVPSEYIRNGTAKMLTLLHPRSGKVRVQGVTSCPNAILHGWLQEQLSAIVDNISDAKTPAPADAEMVQAAWEGWQAGLTQKVAFPAELPPLRMLLILDNLAGHKTPDFVAWLLAHGILPLDTPLGGSWLNLSFSATRSGRPAESIQRILKRRALEGQQPTTPEEIMAWLEAVAAHWNRDPTPFVWGGKRWARRQRQHERRHRVGGSGAYTHRPICRRTKITYGDEQAK